jgi:putative peptidoglycan lipid II flippase
VTGSIAALGYSELLVALLSGTTAGIIGTILYPRLAQAYTLSDEARFSETFSSAVVLILMIGVPFTMGSLLYSDVVVHIIYFRGAFNMDSLLLTDTAFFYYSFGLVFFMLQGFLINVFYSRHDTRTPLLIGVVGVIVNIVSNLILVKYLALGGLALGWSIALFTGMTLLLVALRVKSPKVFAKGMPAKIGKILLASAASVGITYLFFGAVDRICTANAVVMPRMILLGVTMILAAGIYLLILRAFKIEELIHIRQIFKAR